MLLSREQSRLFVFCIITQIYANPSNTTFKLIFSQIFMPNIIYINIHKLSKTEMHCQKGNIISVINSSNMNKKLASSSQNRHYDCDSMVLYIQLNLTWGTYHSDKGSPHFWKHLSGNGVQNFLSCQTLFSLFFISVNLITIYLVPQAKNLKVFSDTFPLTSNPSWMKLSFPYHSYLLFLSKTNQVTLIHTYPRNPFLHLCICNS